jgi:hypothetical protein
MDIKPIIGLGVLDSLVVSRGLIYGSGRDMLHTYIPRRHEF